MFCNRIPVSSSIFSATEGRTQMFQLFIVINFTVSTCLLLNRSAFSVIDCQQLSAKNAFNLTSRCISISPWHLWLVLVPNDWTSAYSFSFFLPVSENIFLFFTVTSEKEVMVSMSSFAKALCYWCSAQTELNPPACIVLETLLLSQDKQCCRETRDTSRATSYLLLWA